MLELRTHYLYPKKMKQSLEYYYRWTDGYLHSWVSSYNIENGNPIKRFLNNFIFLRHTEDGRKEINKWLDKHENNYYEVECNN